MGWLYLGFLFVELCFGGVGPGGKGFVYKHIFLLLTEHALTPNSHLFNFPYILQRRRKNPPPPHKIKVFDGIIKAPPPTASAINP